MLIGDRYKLGSKIGQGGMQQVWSATDLSLGREVAVKAPIVESGSKRFTHSARLSARVRHPNVASALDYLEGKSGEFYVEELIDGIDLQNCMDRFFPRLDGDTSAHVLHHLARGLEASHQVGVIHRDIKPSNVMVSKDLTFSTIKITDFGIAKLAESELEQGIVAMEAGRTQNLSSTMLGAIPFLAPEVLRKRKPGEISIGKPSDVWSLGAMGYWLLSGEYPFGNGFEAIPGIFSGKFKPWDEKLSRNKLTGELVRQLQVLIQRCLAVDPTNRPTATDIVCSIAQLGYLNSKRENGVITKKGPHGATWFARSDNGGGVMVHESEVVAGEAMEVGAKINFVSTPGTPNARAVAIVRLKN